ncbi:MAG: O-antigen ligase family protein [Deltaproteobacteria bacterium]|nr:O-antigen ligase family protein [Deltaproteobacteria bacterium]
MRLPRISKSRLPGGLADGSLFALIALAPVLGGSSSPLVLPLLVTLAVVSLAATMTANYRRGRSTSLHGLSLAFLFLTLFTALQIVPIPPFLLSLISSKAFEIRSFAGQEKIFSPTTYELIATHREVAKLAVYFIVALVAYERVRVRNGLELVVIPVAAGGLGTAALALIHRILGIDQLFGVIPTMSPLSQMVTTFSNPNHAAGFMTLAALCALGLAMGDAAKHRRTGAIGVALVCAFVSMLSLSRGGLFALALGLALLGILSFRLKKSGDRTFQLAASAVFTVAFSVVTLGALWRGQAILEEFGSSADFALSVKLDGIRDAWPMIMDHALVGIGRGSFVSVYPHYKTSPIQLLFVFPENLAVQALAEWGVVVGSAVLVGLATALVLRIGKTRRPLALAALVGCVAVFFHNLVDFSLELPGVAIPVVAILAGTGVEAVKRVRLPTRERVLFPLFVVIFVGSVAAYTTLIGLSGGDLDADLDLLRERAERTLAGQKPGGGPASNDAIAARHPANAYVAAQVAYLAEIDAPPDLPKALDYTNRALFLAPTYADAHLAAGRILIRAGHRAQGFAAMRRAWDLSGADRRDAFIDHILDLADTPEEFALAIPRRIPELDVIREGDLARGIRVALAKKRPSWVRRVLDTAVQDFESVPVGGLFQLALAAQACGHSELTAQLVELVLTRDPRHPKATLLQTRLWMRERRRDEAKTLVDQMLARTDLGEERPDFLKVRINIALAESDLDDAKIYLDQLASAAPATRRGQASILRYRAIVERRAGETKRALEALERAVELEPEDTQYRLERGEALLEARELDRAKADVEFVLKRRPRLGAAKKLLAKIDAALGQEGRTKKQQKGSEAPDGQEAPEHEGSVPPAGEGVGQPSDPTEPRDATELDPPP